jgi:hypothetical protein
MPVPTTEQSLLPEVHAFVGRAEELARLQEAAAAGAIAYVHGAEGIGKSALLRVHAHHCAAQGAATVWADAGEAGGSAPALEEALAREVAALGPDAEGRDPWERLRHLARARAVLVCLDGYDALDAEGERHVRERIRRHTGAGVAFALAGRRSPSGLWAQDPRWRLALREVPLRGLVRAEARALLHRLGLRLDPRLGDDLCACCAGTPGLLVLAAHALRDHYPAVAGGAAPFPAAERDGLTAFCLEQTLHPGSRRRRWRAGAGEPDSADTLLAAAAVLPTPLREFLPVALPARSWQEALAATRDAPLWQRADAGGPGPALDEGVRRRIAAVVDRHRPWAARLWRRRALEHLLALVESRPAATAGIWRMAAPAVAGLAQPGAGAGDQADPCPPPRPAAAGGAPRPQPRAQAGLGPREPAVVVMGVGPGGRGVVARRQTAVSHRCAACIPVPGERGAAGYLGAAAVRACVLALGATVGDAWHVCSEGLPEDVGGAGEPIDAALPCALLAQTSEAFAGVRRLAWVTDPADELPARLGFSPCPTPVPAGARAADALLVHALDPERLDVAAWLRGALAPTVLLDGLASAEERIRATKEALEAFHDPVALARTRAATFAAQAFNLRTVTALRVWLTDMMAVADPHAGLLSGHEVLTRYYIRRAGPHTAIATALSVSRATYYRCFRLALAALAAALFA